MREGVRLCLEVVQKNFECVLFVLFFGEVFLFELLIFVLLGLVELFYFVGGLFFPLQFVPFECVEFSFVLIDFPF